MRNGQDDGWLSNSVLFFVAFSFFFFFPLGAATLVVAGLTFISFVPAAYLAEFAIPRSASGISGGAADGKGISVSWTHLARNSGEESHLQRFFPLGYLDMLGWSSPALCGPLVLLGPGATSFMASIWGTPITSGAMLFYH